MDLSSLDLEKLASEGVRVELNHPGTGEVLKDSKGAPLYIVCMGRDSSKWKATHKRLSAKDADKSTTMDAVDDLLISIMSECTVDWSAEMELEGKKLACSKENAAKVYKQFGWISEQVLIKVTDRAAYFLDHSAS